MTSHDPANIGRIARERFSSALMSDTKWRKLFKAIDDSGFSIERMVVKFIDVDEPRMMQFPPSLDGVPHAYMDTIEFGPVELRAIEWLDFPVDVRPVSNPIGRFPLETRADGTRITGYVR